MSGAVFVTGTDTGVGKTLVSGAILSLLAARGASVVGMKPVAAGCEDGQLNDDVVCLRAHSNVAASLGQMNPYCLNLPVAPHLAAKFAGVSVQTARLSACFYELSAQADYVVVEGAGGLMVPLNDQCDYVDWVAELALPVVLVVGVRLGCLNHALLTQEVLLSRGLTLCGWVANVLDPEMFMCAENVQTLIARIRAPLLGVVPYLPQAKVSDAAAYLSVDGLLDV